jgi:hypothetical protein
MKPKDMRDREFAESIRRKRVLRDLEAKATSKQVDYITGLGGRAHDWTPAETLEWCKDIIVSPIYRDRVSCLLDLTKTEASQAIARLKADIHD